jgi:hypothetical protein
MLKRILAIGALVAVALAPAALLGVLSLHGGMVLAQPYYTRVCENQYVGSPCDSLAAILVAGITLRVAGVALCALAVLLAALALIRVTTPGWIALVGAILATASGAYSLWLSQQALGDHRSLSFLPQSYPPGFFEDYAVQVEQVAPTYVRWGVVFALLTLIMLMLCGTLLWRRTSHPEEDGGTTFSATTPLAGRFLAFGAFAAALLTPVIILGMAYELERPAPCDQQSDAACSSLDAIVAAGAVSRGAGFVLFGLALILGYLLLQQPSVRRQVTFGATATAIAGGAWAFWISQRALEDYAPVPGNPHSYYPLTLFDGREGLMERLASLYLVWSSVELALAIIVVLVTALLLRNRPRPPQQTSALTPAL